MKKVSRGRGRRPGHADTKAAILEAARRRFLAEGYQAVTLRAIAADAGVDVALISYFFGSKQGLFGAAMRLAANPADVIATALPGPHEGIPTRLLHALITTWDDPTTGAPLRALGGAVGQDPAIARLMRELIESQLIEPLTSMLGGGEAARRRAGFAAAQLAGVVFSRYLLELEPVASAPAQDVVKALAPALRLVLGLPDADPSGNPPSDLA
jgi:AcrR family transcriptional regulator